MKVNNPEFVAINNNNNNNKVFNEQTHITQYTFPSSDELKNILRTNDINRILNTVKNRILLDHSAGLDNTRIQNNELNNIHINIINEAKDILRKLGYRINDVEDQQGVVTSWKIYY